MKPFILIPLVAAAFAASPRPARGDSAALMKALHPEWNAETRALAPGSARKGFVSGGEKIGSNQLLVLVELDPEPGSRSKFRLCEVAIFESAEDGRPVVVAKTVTQSCMGVDKTPIGSIDSKPVFAVRLSNDGQRHTLALFTVTASSSVAEVFREEIQSADRQCELTRTGERSLMLTCVGRKAPEFSARAFEWNGELFAETASRYSAGPGSPQVSGIVPGRFIGPVVLGMSRQAAREALKSLGKPSTYEAGAGIAADYWMGTPRGGSSSVVAFRVYYRGDAVIQVRTEFPYKLGATDPTKLSATELAALVESKALVLKEYSGSRGSYAGYVDDPQRGFAFVCVGAELIWRDDAGPMPTFKGSQVGCNAILVHARGTAAIPEGDERPFGIPP